MIINRDSGKFGIKYSASFIWKVVEIDEGNTSKKITLTQLDITLVLV